MKNKSEEDAKKVRAEEDRVKAQFIANVVYHLSANELTLARMAAVACALDLDISLTIKPQAEKKNG